MTIVPGYGNPNAKIMFVGEAPAHHEVQRGRPFVGDAGKELDSWLAASGIVRDNCYFTNVSLRQIKGAKDSHFLPGGKLSPAFIEGLQALAADIQRIRPNIVVALGNWAMQGLLGHQGVMKHRGSVYWSEMFGVKVICVLHPAAILRGRPDDSEKAQGGMYKMRVPSIWDLQKAKAQAAFPDFRPRPRNLLINPEGQDGDEAIDRLFRATKLVFDIESFGGLDLACIGFSDGDPEWAVTWAYNRDPARFDLFKQLLERDVPKYGQNLMYDATFLDQIGIETKNIVWDTMIASHVLYPDLPKSLAFLTSVYTDMPYYKEEGKIWKEGAFGPNINQYWLYNAKDVCSTAETAAVQQPELAERNLTHIFTGTMKVFDPLRQATKVGMKIDFRQLWKFIEETQEKRDAAQKELNALAGREVNVNSPKQMKVLLYEDRKLSTSKNASTDAKTILDLAARTGDPAPRLVVSVRQERKLLSNYYNTDILSSDGRVRFGFNVVGTFGARISSSAPLWGRGLNGQNIPVKARSMFVPDDGYTLLEFDQAQAEAVIVAYLALDPVHMDCFRTGKDVHRVTAALALGIPDWRSISKEDPVRDLYKRCNHGFNYNMGPVQFMYVVNEEYDPSNPNSLKLDRGTATAIRNRYLEIRPALPAWWESIRHELRLNRTLRTPLGREYQFLDKMSDDLLRIAYSYKPQATVGETTNIGIRQVLGIDEADHVEHSRIKQRAIREAGVQFLLQVHDSTVWQVPNDAVDEVAPYMMQLLEVPLLINGHQIVVPIDGAKGENWNKKYMDSLGTSRKSCEVGYG